MISGHHSLLDEVKSLGEQHGLTMLPPLPKPFRAAQVEEIIQTRLPARSGAAAAADTPRRD